MSWEMFIPLMIKEGFLFAMRAFEFHAAGGKPTPEQLAELRLLATYTSSSRLEDAIIRSGRDLNSPEAKALLALTGKPQ